MIRGKRLALFAAMALALSAVPLPADDALDVDEAEVSSAQGRAIQFINYEGPHAVIETAESIRSIGRALGRAVAAGALRSGEVGRYSVIHAVDPAVPTGFDADIVMLGEGARVDHVKNVRRIVAGFLEEAYGYSPADADTLAVFVTIYNAVYRGDMGYFGSRYKPVVTKELSPSTAGMSTRWDEWAGRSRIVIPLSGRAGMGVLGSVDTTPITDAPTVQSLKDESPTAGVEERMDVVDIKERAQDEEKAAIEVEKARIEREEAAIAEEKATAAEEKPAAAFEAEAAATTGPGAARAAEDGAAEKGGDQEASLAVSEKAREEEAAAAESETAAREARLEADKAALAAREEAAAAKDAEIAADRESIAADQKEAIGTEVSAAAAKEAAGVPLFELVDPNLPFSRIALVDLKTGEVIRRSGINTIRAATALDLGDAYVAIAGQVTGSGGAVRLVRIPKADYSDLTQGADDVFADSRLWKIGSSIYAVVKRGELWAIGRFDPVSLELKASSAPVSRWTFLTESGGRLVAQGPGGAFLVLQAEDLSTAAEIAR
ncbi:MAG TPA: P83/100 family protein [Spirochaetales bacterium]|nr:P83/100 family protein [Spirochaetales bacterium]